MYVYRKSEPHLWTVGFYTPEGGWVPESDHDTQEKAAERVRFMNGAPAGSSFTQLEMAVIDAAEKFVAHEENEGDGIDDLWRSDSLDIPVEFMELVNCVRDLRRKKGGA